MVDTPQYPSDIEKYLVLQALFNQGSYDWDAIARQIRDSRYPSFDDRRWDKE
ncbi:hypothetical protein EV182_004949, partial [Spiromyces aspiralis]